MFVLQRVDLGIFSTHLHLPARRDALHLHDRIEKQRKDHERQHPYQENSNPVHKTCCTPLKGCSNVGRCLTHSAASAPSAFIPPSKHSSLHNPPLKSLT